MVRRIRGGANEDQTYRISGDGVRDLTDTGDGLALLEHLEHLGEAHGITGLGGVRARRVGGGGGDGGLINEQVGFGGGVLPVQGVRGRSRRRDGVVLGGQQLRRLVVGVASQP